MIYAVFLFAKNIHMSSWVFWTILVLWGWGWAAWGWFSAKHRMREALKKNKPPVTGEYGKVKCPICKKTVALTKAGNLYRHRIVGPESDYCLATGLSLDVIHQQIMRGTIHVSGQKEKRKNG